MSMLYVVHDEDASEYSEKLCSLLKKEGIETTPYTYSNYTEIKDVPGMAPPNGCKYIFLGVNPQTLSSMPEIKTWSYQKYGCQIGWKENVCVIYAREADLIFDYKNFREHCQKMKREHEDVIIPPETTIGESIECVKRHVLSTSDSHCAKYAQYSILIYEFVDSYLNDFVSGRDIAVDEDIEKIKDGALKELTWKQNALCLGIIHAAMVSTSALALITTSVGDVTPARISMMVRLANVFDTKITKINAEIILKSIVASVVERRLSKAGVLVADLIVNRAMAGIVTAIIGWTYVSNLTSKQSSQ